MADHDDSRAREGYSSQHANRAPAPSAASTSAPPTRPESPNGSMGEIHMARDNPFATPTGHNPFGSPETSRPPSTTDFSSAVRNEFDGRAARFFHSRRVKKGEIEKPWIKQRDPKEKWVTILPCIGILIGLAVSGFLVWDGIHSVVKHKYCSVLVDDFSQGLNTNTWTHEIQVGGFGYVAPIFPIPFLKLGASWFFSSSSPLLSRDRADFPPPAMASSRRRRILKTTSMWRAAVCSSRPLCRTSR